MVFVLGKRKKPLMPCSEKRARKLLEAKRAVVHRMYPFTIRLKDRVDGALQPVRVKLDPGSKQTGIAVVRDEETVEPETGELRRIVHVMMLLQLNHRGAAISDALKSRASLRRHRRNRNTRYRPARFNNRPKAKGWLAPSLMHRVDTIMAWVSKLRRLCPVSAISQELVKFDMQRMANAEISGIEYQQGQLAGYEVREYLLEKHGRQCAYCGVKNVPLEIEHIVPRSKGGTNRIGNLTLACHECNTAKGNMSVEEFLYGKPKVLEKIQKGMSVVLKDAAAVNATRWKLYNALKATGLEVETGSGALTKYNRSVCGIPKEHALDAACVGVVSTVKAWKIPTLMVKCAGRGCYKRTQTDKYGFPRAYKMKSKAAFGFQTGDICKAEIPSGKKKGVYFGRAVVRANGQFDLSTKAGKINVPHRFCSIVQKNDGYGYSWEQREDSLDNGCIMMDKHSYLDYLKLHGVDQEHHDYIITEALKAHVALLRDEVEEFDEIVLHNAALFEENVIKIEDMFYAMIYKNKRLAVSKPGKVHVLHIAPRLMRVCIV